MTQCSGAPALVKLGMFVCRRNVCVQKKKVVPNHVAAHFYEGRGGTRYLPTWVGATNKTVETLSPFASCVMPCSERTDNAELLYVQLR
jgi:hypothetical protein